MQKVFPLPSLRIVAALLFASLLAFTLLVGEARAQQTNPVDRRVTNPITDTPNVNPLEQPQPVRPRLPVKDGEGAQATDVLDVRADRQTVTGPEKARVVVYEGNVDARIGTYRL